MRKPVPAIVWAVGVLLAAVLLPAPAAADGGRLRIRTYDASTLPEADRAAAFATAAAILDDAGVTLERVGCEAVTAAAGVHPCLAPLDARELSVRLVRLPAPDTPAGAVTLGYSLVEAPARAGALATVYVNRVADLAAASEVDLPTLLGRAMAHEIGHLLLGTNTHARAGVMRAVWSPDSLRRSGAADWRFTPRDAEALRASVSRRTAHPLQTW